MNRRAVTVEQGVIRIDQRIRVTRATLGTDVSGSACIVARVDVNKGRVAYLQDQAHILAPKRFAILLPPFTLVQASLEQCEITTAGFAFRPAVTHPLPSQPLLIPFQADCPPMSTADVLRCFVDAESALPIGRARNPLLLALEAKTILDKRYDRPLTIADVAKNLRVSPALLSRTFTRTYGIPPVRYRHHLRVMDALVRFAEGGVPATIFQDVGFNDLSRFYKILRQVACAAPRAYRPVRSKNAKT